MAIIPPSQHDGSQYIDPKLLEYTYGAIEGPVFEATAQPRDVHELDVDLEMALASHPDQSEGIQDQAEEERMRNARLDDVYLVPATPMPVRRSSLRPDAQEFVPTKPRLVLQTGQQGLLSSQQIGTTPTTPQIKVLAPVDYIGTSNDHPQRQSQSRGRQRRKSSPGVRPSHSSIRRRGSRGPNNGLLSPIRAGAWVIGHSYHPGDRYRSMKHPPTASMPLDVAWAPGMPPPSSSSQSGGPYFCSYQECKHREKAWDTKSERNKHQRIHMPKEHRPHPCPDCPKRFQYPKDVVRHRQAKHQGGTPSACHICDRILTRNDNLHRHLERVHGIMQTPSVSAESSVASPASTASVSNFSDMVSGDSPPSTAHTSPWSQVQDASRSFQQRLLPFLDESEYPPLRTLNVAPTSHPMARWRTN